MSVKEKKKTTKQKKIRESYLLFCWLSTPRPFVWIAILFFSFLSAGRFYACTANNNTAWWKIICAVHPLLGGAQQRVQRRCRGCSVQLSDYGKAKTTLVLIIAKREEK
jgi:hypothetical protein